MTSKAPNAAAAESAVKQLGTEFRRLRQTRGERIEDIAIYLDIKSTYLFGIEQGDLSVIPSRRQAKSMVRTYANYLGLDGNSIVSPMDTIIASLEGDIAPHGLKKAKRFDRTSIVILAASVILGVLFGWSQIGDVNQFDLITPPVTADVIGLDGDEAESGQDLLSELLNDGAEEGVSVPAESDEAEETDQVAADAEATESVVSSIDENTEAAEALLAEIKTALADNEEALENGAEPSADEPSQVPANEQVEAKGEERPANVLAALVAERGDGAHIYEAENTDARVIVRALGDVLVQVTSQSRDYVWTQTMKPREMLLVPNRDDLEIWTGDASGIEILLDGEILPPLGPSGTAISGLPLTASSLEALSAVTSENGAKPTF